MRTLSVNDEITVSGLHRTIVSIRWAEKGKGELMEKDEVLYPALDWCILKTNKGELLKVDVLADWSLRLCNYTFNGISILSNLYDCFPCKTYWYIENKIGETFHHKDSKWRRKQLKEMTTYYFTSPESALKTFEKLKP